MLRSVHPLTLLIPFVAAVSACSGDGGDLDPADAGNGGNPDAAPADLGVSGDGGPDVSTDLGDPDGGETDAGLPDTGPPDMGGTPDMGAFACDFPDMITGVLDQEAVVAFDTSASELRPRDLGLLCGNTDPATKWAPQQIVAYQVPGTGPVAVRFSTRNMGTSGNFDTVVQIRRGNCEMPPPLEDGRFPSPTCFEDSSQSLQSPDFRSEGAIQATGGEMLFFVVTGFSGGRVPQLDDQGMVTLSITPSANEPPTLTDASAFVFGPDVAIRLDGDDPDGNLRGAIVNFRIGGQIVDIYGAGTTDGDIAAIVFAERPNEIVNQVGRPQIPIMVPANPPPGVQGLFELNADDVGLNPAIGSFMANVGIEQIGIRVFDEDFAISQEVVADVSYDPPRVGFGEDCSTSFCADPYLCEADVCSASQLAQLTCDPANLVDGGLSETSLTSELVVSIPPGDPAFGTPSCVPEGRAEAGEGVVAIDIPSTGRFDFVATTDTDVTAGRDTIMYLRSDCLDPRTELAGACNDDIAADNDRSAFEIQDIAPGPYFLFVEFEAFSPLGRPFDIGVDLRLRPIVGEGEACDPAGQTSRCDVGMCQGPAGAETCQL